MSRYFLRLLTAIALFWGNSSAVVAARPLLTPSEVAAWQSDLDLLAQQLPLRHANLHHDVSPEELEGAFATLRERLPTLDRGSALVELARLVARVRDGHTAFLLLPFPGGAAIPGIQQLPLQLYAFPDGLRVVALERGQAQWLGAKIEAIGGVPIATALARVEELLPRDNTMGLRDLTPFYLALHEVLAATGLAADQRAAFTVSLDDRRGELVVQPLTVQPDAAWVDKLVSLPGPRSGWVGAGDNAETQPLWLSRQSEPYWFERRADGSIYAQVNLLRDTQVSFASWSEQLLAAVPRDATARLVLDLRLNRGGDGDLIWPLIHGLIRHDLVNQAGRLFVLTGRRTFSAAQLFANALERHTAARFVGEPTGSRPNHWGELGLITLPQTRLTVFVSELWFQEHPRDRRPWIAPHVAAELTYADLAAGRDPALAAVDAWVPLPSARDVMGPALAADDSTAAVNALRAVASSPVARNPWRNLYERELNDLGYELLAARREAAAIAVFTLATELYPSAANAWDSLGEAFAQSGNRARAAFCYARSLHLDPTNHAGARVLADLLGDVP